MADSLTAGRLSADRLALIGLHATVPAADGGRSTELAALLEGRAGRTAEIILFPERPATAARPVARTGEVRPFPAIFRPAASAGSR